MTSTPSPAPTNTRTPVPVLTPQEQEWKDDPEAAFETGVQLAFERWEVLNMAVENGWCGGVDKGERMRDDLIAATIDWFQTAKERLHWDDVSEFLYDALLSSFHVDAQDRSDEQLARLLCRLYDDCMVRHDYAGLSKLLSTRKAVHSARAEARRQLQVDMHSEDEEDDGDEGEDGDEFDEDDEREAKQYGDDLDRGIASLSVTFPAEAKSDEAEQRTAPDPPEEDDGWTTVSSAKRKPKGKGT